MQSLSVFSSPVATRRRRGAAGVRCAATPEQQSGDPEAAQLLLRGLSLLPESMPQRRTRLQGELAVLNEKARRHARAISLALSA